MENNKIVRRISAALKAASTPDAKASFAKFFKEKVTGYGVKLTDVHKIAKKIFREIKGASTDGIMELCGMLMDTGNMEEKFAASEWAEMISDDFREKDFAVLEKWVKNSISNWAECDTLCNHAVGSFITKYPAYMAELKKWARSKNRWVKRAACVSLILPARRGEFLADVFELADILRNDPDDLVQKGYGWMLKEASRKHAREVFDYLMKYKKTMPRTAFRYAIEKMPDDMRKKAMA
jgi:3-methyladenine DNA glycosylase AlkD